MKKTIILAGIILTNLISAGANAQTQFIKYKKYLVPIQAPPLKECADGKPRVIISTDLGALTDRADPDDIQSLVHLLLVSNRVKLLGLITSAGTNTGREKSNIANIVDAYALDYANNSSKLAGYPHPNKIYSVVRQGVHGKYNPESSNNYYNATTANHAGAKLIIDEAKKVLSGENCGPVYVLVWGPIPNLALALRESEDKGLDIHKALRIYFIASSNEDANRPAFNYIKKTFLDNDRLWFIRSNSTFKGMHEGLSTAQEKTFLDSVSKAATSSDQSCLSYVLRKASDKLHGIQPKIWVKAGDTPSLLHVLDPNWNLSNSYPSSSNWGGEYKLKSSRHTQYWVDGPGPNSVHKYILSAVYPDWKAGMDRFQARLPAGCRSAVRPTIP